MVQYRYDLDDTFLYDIVTLIYSCKLLVFLHNLIVGSYGYAQWGFTPATYTRVCGLKIAEGNGKLQLTIKYAKIHILKLIQIM